jgi:hypothetical protein
VLKDADAAFTGKLVSVKKIDDGIPPGEPAPPPDAIFRYRVLRDYKAPLGAYVKVRSSTSGGACGLAPDKGRKYGIGIYGRPKRWGSGLCSVVRPRALRRVASADRRDRGGRVRQGQCISTDSSGSRRGR